MEVEHYNMNLDGKELQVGHHHLILVGVFTDVYGRKSPISTGHTVHPRLADPFSSQTCYHRGTMFDGKNMAMQMGCQNKVNSFEDQKISTEQ